jgi:hypothetical protein
VGPPGHPWSQRLDIFWGFQSFLALVEAVTVAVHLQDMDVMRETIEKCPGEALGAKDLSPFIKRQIAGHQGGALFVALAKHFKQKFGPGFGQTHPKSLFWYICSLSWSNVRFPD